MHRRKIATGSVVENLQHGIVWNACLARHRHCLGRGDKGDGTEHIIGEFHDLRRPRPVTGNDDRLAPKLQHRHQVGNSGRISRYHHGQRACLGACDAAADRNIDDGDAGRCTLRLDLADKRHADVQVLTRVFIAFPASKPSGPERARRKISSVGSETIIVSQVSASCFGEAAFRAWRSRSGAWLPRGHHKPRVRARRRATCPPLVDPCCRGQGSRYASCNSRKGAEPACRDRP